MIAKVIKPFKDKFTKKIYSPKNKKANVYEGSEERVKYLQQLGYVEVEEPETDPRLDGNVEQVKAALEGIEKEELEKLLVEEKDNKNRKGVIEHIEQLLSNFDEEGK